AAGALAAEVAGPEGARSVDDAVVREARERVGGAQPQREAAGAEALARFEREAVVVVYIR
ncbi:MAG: hypothetical protein M3416_18660, partial [Acidobacteriota bacterium]|nr:hypothetical protein [Acidobacteriota bacterium]